MAATAGGVTMEEVSWSLPYSVGIQIIWAAKVANGEMIKALDPDRKKVDSKRFKQLLG